MVSPHPVPIFLGSLVLMPLFAAICAGTAQWRWRRRAALFEKKGLVGGAIPKPPPTPPLVVVGVAAGYVLSLFGILDSPDQEPDLATAALRWVSLLVLLGTMFVSIRLAFKGMPPEPNFVLTDDSQQRASHLRVPAKVPGPDLFDAREL